MSQQVTKTQLLEIAKGYRDNPAVNVIVFSIEEDMISLKPLLNVTGSQIQTFTNVIEAGNLPGGSRSLVECSVRISNLISRLNRGKEIGINKDVTYRRFNDLAKILKPYGVIGYEYNGGAHLGGNRFFHRAFSIWDEHYVNEHKTGIIR